MNLFLVVLFVVSVSSGLCRNNINDTPKNNETETFAYFGNPNSAITIPVMVHLDAVLVRSLPKEYKTRGRKKLKKMFRNIFNEVENLFRRPNLRETVWFSILGVKFLRNDTKYAMDENVSKYLKNYCQWQGLKKVEKKYFSVLFTGLDVYYYGKNNKRIKTSAARGYMKGICSLWNSCSILKWRGSNIAFKLTHEIGHSLGLSHDGSPYNDCQGQYIMNAKYNALNPAKYWSPCSGRDFHQFLLSKYATCLKPEGRSQFF